MNRINRCKISITMVIFLSLLLGCSKDVQVQTTDKINPIEQSEITEMTIEHSNDQRFTQNKNVWDKKVIDQVISNLTSINVKKLGVDQEKPITDNGKKWLLEPTYRVTLLNGSGEIKTSFALFSDQELMLADLRTMLGSSRTISYINSNDDKTLQCVKEVYNLVKQQNDSSDTGTKVEYKDITKEMPKNFEDIVGELSDGGCYINTIRGHADINYYHIYFKSWKPYSNITVVNTGKAIKVIYEETATNETCTSLITFSLPNDNKKPVELYKDGKLVQDNVKIGYGIE